MQQNVTLQFWQRFHSLYKLLVALASGLLAWACLRFLINDNRTAMMAGWDLFSLLLIIFEWITFARTSVAQIKVQAGIQDLRRTLVFILVLAAALFSILAVILMITTKAEGETVVAARMPVAIAGMMLSWFLIHTLFTLRYAHIYYGHDVANPGNHAGGLLFPNDKKPDYFDFAYFSFVLGMTFQVSDVGISAKKLRRLALFHGLIAFGYNTVMIALVINIIA